MFYPTHVEITSIDENTKTAFVSLTIRSPHSDRKLAEELLTTWPVVLEYSRAEDKTFPLILTLRIKEKNLKIESIKIRDALTVYKKKRIINRNGYLTFITDEDLNFSNVFSSRETIYENIYRTGISAFTGIYRYDSNSYSSVCKALISQFIYDAIPGGIDEDNLYRVLTAADFKEKFKTKVKDKVDYLIEPVNEKNNITPPLYIFYYNRIESNEYILTLKSQEIIRKIFEQLPCQAAAIK